MIRYLIKIKTIKIKGVNMKKVLGLMLIGCLSVGTLFANDRTMNGSDNMEKREEMKKEKLSEAKQRTTERINERISMLEKAKNCINSANSKDDLDNCRPKEHKMNHNNGEKNGMNEGK